jgi:D-alanyl-D-alanine dipeptidase
MLSRPAHQIRSVETFAAASAGIALVPVTGVKAFLRYAVEGLPGAMDHAFLAPPVFDRLLEAQARVRSRDSRFELLIWDAYRTRHTQRAIFERYAAELTRRYRELNSSELKRRALEFISDPDGVFPHGTGGAVDVTLLCGGNVVSMGTDFDEFIPEAAADWFRFHPPVNASEELAARNREILRTAMEGAGFVGIASEWWHFEFATKTWSLENGSRHLE